MGNVTLSLVWRLLCLWPSAVELCWGMLSYLWYGAHDACGGKNGAWIGNVTVSVVCRSWCIRPATMELRLGTLCCL